ncbi:MAG: CoA transferase, partial [Proteobacteria bacterium]|nr:CoA transferase [Pseudomonadota bacterium]
MSVNRGNESIALDLKSKQDRARTPTTPTVSDTEAEETLGKDLDYDVLLKKIQIAKGTLAWSEENLVGDTKRKEVNKYRGQIRSLEAQRKRGFGHSGPDSGRPAYDMVVQGLGGIMSVTGHPGGPPTRIGMSIGDIGAGLYTAIGVNAALYHRATTGAATKIDIGMLDCQLALLENAIMRYFVSGTVPGPLGARHPTITPFEVFSTKDGHLIIAAGNDALYVKLCAA